MADFHLSKVPDQKVKKTAARISLELDPTPDILAELGRKKGDRLLIGFAAETQNLQQEARRKLESKNCDMVVGNLVGGRDMRLRIRPERSGAGAAHGRDHSPAPRLQARNRRPHLRRNPETAAGAARRQWTLNTCAAISSFTRTSASRPSIANRHRSRNQSRDSAGQRPGPRTSRRSLPTGDTLLRSSTTSATAAAAACTRGATRSSSASATNGRPLVFVGEGPGADEDAQGIPFVGRAGQLLTQMIEGTAKKEGIPLTRADVYICNVVKCRPPGNRTPEPDEMEICGQFLFRQLSAIQPKAICALGGTAARAVPGHKEGVTKMRGKWFQWRDIPVMVTYHPSYLLRALQPGRQARSLGGPEEGPPLRLRLMCYPAACHIMSRGACGKPTPCCRSVSLSASA